MEEHAATAPTILFVDDEDVIRASLSRELRMERFAVTAVGSGDEAVAALDSAAYDLVLTDLMMPGTDGFGVLKAVKRRVPMTGVIILTGYGDMASAIDALRLGADDFALKPCDVEELVFRIRRCLEKRTLLQELSLRNRRLEEEIGQRQRAEHELAESEKRFRLALDASSNGVWDRNLSTGELYLGENWWRSLGYPASAGIGGQHFEDLLHPEDRDRVLAMTEAHIRGETDRFEVEFRIRHRAGRWQWMLSRGQVVARDAQGRAVRVIGTHTDITRLKRVEAELERARADLEQRVRERTAELSQTNVALSVLLKKREEDRTVLGEQVLANAAKLVDPFLDRLEVSGLNALQAELVAILRANIAELTAPFAGGVAGMLIRLTPAEIQVANLVKLGKRTKEIAALMHLSPGTISIHRKNIRKKLGLTHRKTNLQTMLSMRP
ncbi:response regulator [Desulfobulbus elongatus]|uniref:response regulator n=1 Tax=Desulfobulbus elongatus TaxID=53332 RepID=UPI0006842A88|nr:response regulator [Desulfobulbus elongatus]